MIPTLLDNLRCPLCKSKGLELKAPEMHAEEIWEGKILCGHCQKSYVITKGIPCLLLPTLLEAHNDQWFEQWMQRRREQDKIIADEDRKRHKEICREETAREGISEDTARICWERLLYKENQELKENLGSKHSAKWAISKENISERNDYIFRYIEELEESFVRKQVLNVGPGIDDDLIERLEARKAEVINCDIILDPLFRLRDNNNKRECICSDLMSLPFDDNIFDSVFCFHVIHHIVPMKQALSEAIRVLKPSGKIFIVELNYYHFLSLQGKLLPNRVKRMVRKGLRMLLESEKRFFRPSPYEKLLPSKTIIELMGKAGFININRKTVTHAPFFLPRYILKVWNNLGFRFPKVFDPVALEYMFFGSKSRDDLGRKED